MYKKMENARQRQKKNICLTHVESIIQNSQRIDRGRVFISTLLNNFRHFAKKRLNRVKALYNAKKSC